MRFGERPVECRTWALSGAAIGGAAGINDFDQVIQTCRIASGQFQELSGFVVHAASGLDRCLFVV